MLATCLRPFRCMGGELVQSQLCLKAPRADLFPTTPNTLPPPSAPGQNQTAALQAWGFLRPCPGVSSRLQLHSAGPFRPQLGTGSRQESFLREDTAQLRNQILDAQMRNRSLKLHPELDQLLGHKSYSVLLEQQVSRTPKAPHQSGSEQ